MTVRTASLGVDAPTTPLCGILNNYCGVTLAEAIEATAGEAATQARAKAKSVAQEALNRASPRNCPAGCGAGSTANSGDDEPKLKRFENEDVLGPFEDPRTGMFVAYAVAFWEREADCAGNPGQQIPLEEGSWMVEFHYPSQGQNPECDKKTLYAGCVISKGVARLLDTAARDANEKAVTTATGLQTTDRARDCPTNCQPPRLDPPDPPPPITPVRIFKPQLFQMKRKPYAVFALAHFKVTIGCPAVVVEEEEEEGEGGGGEFMREPAPKRPTR